MKKTIIRKVLNYSLVICFVLYVIPVMAQDSATVARINDLLSGDVSKWPWLAKAAAILAIVSEVLSIIPQKFIPANGVVDLIVKWIRAIRWQGQKGTLPPTDKK